jgi:hypothetical protein
MGRGWLRGRVVFCRVEPGAGGGGSFGVLMAWSGGGGVPKWDWACPHWVLWGLRRAFGGRHSAGLGFCFLLWGEPGGALVFGRWGVETGPVCEAPVCEAPVCEALAGYRLPRAERFSGPVERNQYFPLAGYCFPRSERFSASWKGTGTSTLLAGYCFWGSWAGPVCEALAGHSFPRAGRFSGWVERNQYFPLAVLFLGE